MQSGIPECHTWGLGWSEVWLGVGVRFYCKYIELCHTWGLVWSEVCFGVGVRY